MGIVMPSMVFLGGIFNLELLFFFFLLGPLLSPSSLLDLQNNHQGSTEDKFQVISGEFFVEYQLLEERTLGWEAAAMLPYLRIQQGSGIR